MHDPTAMIEAQEQALGIFADAMLKLALHIQQEALDAQDLDQKVRLAGAFHRLGRGLRQTVALQAKLARDARIEAVRTEAAKPPRGIEPLPEPEVEPPSSDPKVIAVRRRRDWLTRGVDRCVWNEYERDGDVGEFTVGSLLEDLSERLADLMADPEAFLALDPDALLVELCKELGLTPPTFHPPAPPATPSAAVANGPDSS